ncbi:hypothetical protein Ahy_A09g043235 [Arachis hypogaea]|uniref:DUF4283 domain-containing protein n=1 Tax=Arachis hypogaea TaxID=3818 RepID=A0A445BHW0_ARAHY|nr:hypothetical protein Ahy_A09g043235 [Arachis hypogaea]
MWGDPQGLVITNAGPNSFILNFKNQEEARRAYDGGPWIIEGHMLSLQWWSPNLSIEEVNNNQLPIWIQIHGLPYDKINIKNAEKIGAIVGRIISAENPFVEGNMLRFFLRVRVEINNEARKAGIRRIKEKHNNWVEELWEARERSLQGREWLKRQITKRGRRVKSREYKKFSSQCLCKILGQIGKFKGANGREISGNTGSSRSG